MSEPQIQRRPDAECFQVNEKTLEKPRTVDLRLQGKAVTDAAKPAWPTGAAVTAIIALLTPLTPEERVAAVRCVEWMVWSQRLVAKAKAQED